MGWVKFIPGATLLRSVKGGASAQPVLQNWLLFKNKLRDKWGWDTGYLLILFHVAVPLGQEFSEVFSPCSVSCSFPSFPQRPPREELNGEQPNRNQRSSGCSCPRSRSGKCFCYKSQQHNSVCLTSFCRWSSRYEGDTKLAQLTAQAADTGVKIRQNEALGYIWSVAGRGNRKQSPWILLLSRQMWVLGRATVPLYLQFC